MIITKTIKACVIVSGIALLAACGGGGSKEEYPTGDRYKTERPGVADPSATASTNTATQGVFLDSPVVGLDYKTATTSGKTDSQGKFNYSGTGKVEFFYGSISFGSSDANSLVTPLDLSADSNVVINQLRLLQTLDVDGDPSNGILLPDSGLIPADININFAQSQTDFSNDANVLALLAATTNVTTLVTAEAAQAHFNQSLSSYKSIAR